MGLLLPSPTSPLMLLLRGQFSLTVKGGHALCIQQSLHLRCGSSNASPHCVGPRNRLDNCTPGTALPRSPVFCPRAVPATPVQTNCSSETDEDFYTCVSSLLYAFLSPALCPTDFSYLSLPNSKLCPLNSETTDL